MIPHKQVVVYYTHTYFLDATLETIQSIKDNVELHILIELAPESKHSTIINIDCIEHFNTIEPAEKVLGYVKWLQLKSYFDGVASVNFLIHKNKQGFSTDSFKVAWIAGKWIKNLNPDIIHFDTISQRALGLFPFILGRKNFITIHDPLPHSGEDTWKQRLTKIIFFPIANGFFFYSKFAYHQFKSRYPNSKTFSNVIHLQPYSFIKQYIDHSNYETDLFILFYGRISKYKGIDILLNAIPLVLKSFPNEKFVIVGKCDSFKIDPLLVSKYRNNLIFVSTYLSIEDLAKCVLSAKFIVCPYRDATQSGVLMTSRSLGKTTIATNVGAFPEYIQDNHDGLLVNVDAFDLANTIIKALNNNYYKLLERNVNCNPDTSISLSNKESILNAYQCAISKLNLTLQLFKKNIVSEQVYQS